MKLCTFCEKPARRFFRVVVMDPIHKLAQIGWCGCNWCGCKAGARLPDVAVELTPAEAEAWDAVEALAR